MEITPDAIRIHVPVAFKRRGGRKLIMLPEGSPAAAASARQDATLINGIAKAWRWQELYERGKFASLEAFTEKYKINKSYAARVMRLNLLAPDIRMAIMDGEQPKDLQLADLLHPFPADWREQRKIFGFIKENKNGIAET
ncbi:MAG: hypothetical protein EYC62_00780 [Alphaproteobacteria bacterium]|nr:MAG: hypothetical protein EYC62_00780 [Alphaproteobacteria bacterium]